MENPNFYAIIPSNIRYAKDLSMFQKLLYWEITALTDKTWYCWASNSYFWKLYWKNNEWISRVISDMAKKWYIEVFIDSAWWNQRKIYLWEVKKTSWKVIKNTIIENNIPIAEKDNTYCRKEQDPIIQKDKHNNTSISNIINNNISKDILFEKTKSFSDLLNEILVDFEFIEKLKRKFNTEEKEIKISAEKFFLYWTEKNPNWRKERREMQTTFDIRRRFYTWLGNDFKWRENKPLKYKDHVNIESVKI